MIQNLTPKIFISSTNSDLVEYRSKVRDVLLSHNCLPIMNEYWPAMDSSAVDACMRKVDSADVYIGIFAHRYGHCPHGSEISITEMEFNQARLQGIPRLCFLVDENYAWPPDYIEDGTGKVKLQQLKSRLENSIVRAKFTTPDSLATAVSIAISNALQTNHVDTRLVKLDEMYRASRARCIARWCAVGVSKEIAELMADDVSIGEPLPQLISNKAHSVRMLVADIGSGKSLIVERLLKIAIDTARRDLQAPIPIYFNNEPLPEHFQKAVLENCEGLGDITLQGAAIFIDGVDARGIDYLHDILAEAHTVVNQWTETTVIIATRLVPRLNVDFEAFSIPKLTETETIKLLKRISGDWIGDYYLKHYNSSIREAVSRPLFAILLGVYLNDSRNREKQFSIGNLISNLVEQSIGNINLIRSKIDDLLTKLACMSIERNGRLVPTDELAQVADAGVEELDRLKNSNLIIFEEHAVSFALPIFTEWFGALSLLSGSPSIEEIINDRDALERWRFPLVIALSNYSHNRTRELIAAIVESDPGFASQIVQDALSSHVSEPNQRSILPSEVECKERIEFTMNTWVKGLGALARLIAPVNNDNSLWHFNTRISRDADIIWLSVFWYSEEKDITTSSRAPLQDTWAWRWTWKQLTDNLKKTIKNRALPVSSGILHDEFLARTIASVVGRSDWFPPDGVSLEELERQLLQARGYLPSKKLSMTTYVNDRPTLEQVWAQVKQLQEIGETKFTGLWNRVDQPQELFRLGSYFTEETLLERTSSIYLAALEGYQTLVMNWFPSFAHRLSIFTMMPAILTGVISGDYLSWYCEPLPAGSENQVDIRLGSGKIEWTDSEWEVAFKKYKALRPYGNKLWIRNDRLELYQVDPATHLVYSWLESDLKDINWI